MRLHVKVLWSQVKDVEIVCERIGKTDEGEKLYRTCEMRLGGVGPIPLVTVLSESDMHGVTRIP